MSWALFLSRMSWISLPREVLRATQHQGRQDLAGGRASPSASPTVPYRSRTTRLTDSPRVFLGRKAALSPLSSLRPHGPLFDVVGGDVERLPLGDRFRALGSCRSFRRATGVGGTVTRWLSFVGRNIPTVRLFRWRYFLADFLNVRGGDLLQAVAVQELAAASPPGPPIR